MILLLTALMLQQAGAAAAPRDAAGPRANAPATLEGRVVADADGQPLRNARVTVTRTDQDESDPILTDGAGRFRLTDLAPGRYVVRARKPGYATARFGARRALDPAMSLDLAAGARVAGIELRLVRGAAISGRAFDDLGEPVVGAEIDASEVVGSGTRSRLVSVRAARTDDLGEYRLAGLPAGTYVVSGKVIEFGPSVALSIPGSGLVTGEPTYPQVYFPSAATPAQARPIAVSAGQEVTATDLVFRQIRHPKLTATVTDASGQPVGGRYVVGSINDDVGTYLRSGTFDAGDGITTDIDPGDAIVQVMGEQGQAIARLTVGEEDLTTSFVLTKGAALAGRVVFDGPSPPSASSLSIVAGQERAVPMFGASGARVKADGTFVLEGLHGQVSISVRNLPAGWTLRSLSIGGREMLDAPLEVRGTEQIADAILTISNQRSRLALAVTNESGAVAAACEVVVFPENTSLVSSGRRLSVVRADLNGRAVVDGLLPGAYLAVALPDVDETRQATPEYLNALRPLATPVAIAAGEHHDIRLTLKRIQ